MLIGIDCRAALGPNTGDRTYILNLLRGLAELGGDGSTHDIRFQLLLDKPDTEGVLPQAPHFQPVVLSAPNSRLWTLAALPLHARESKLDGLHVLLLAPPVLSCPLVITIHDVVWRAFPRTFPQRDRAVLNAAMPFGVRRANRIICGTRAARRDLQRFLNVSPQKIRVTPYAVEPRYREKVSIEDIQKIRSKYFEAHPNAPYILSVGVQQPRKNVGRLIAAFERFQKQFPHAPHVLAIVGKQGWNADFSHRAAENPNIVFTGYVPDDGLPALYAGAQVFAYPSLYEGFGLPIHEAMACGCAVVTSNRGAMREVAGNAAQLVDPRSPDSICEGLSKILWDEERRRELQELGRKRVESFTLQAQALSTLGVFREAFD